MRAILLICTTKTELDPEYAVIVDAIRGARHRDCFATVFAPAVTLDALIHAMNYHRPTLLHVAGHGTDAGLELPFEWSDMPEGSQHVAPERLAKLLRPHAPQLRCVVLNACHTSGHARAIAGVVDVGIGVHGIVYDDGAGAFARSFYGALASGLSLGDSFDQACSLGVHPHELHPREPDRSTLVLASGACLDDDSHRMTLTLNIDLSAVDAKLLEQIMAAIKTIAQGDDVHRRHISRGSTKLEIQTSAAGARALLDAHASGRMSQLAGIELLSIEQHGDLDLELLMRWRSGSNDAGKRLLERNHRRVADLLGRTVGHSARAELTARTLERLLAPGFAWDCTSFLSLVFGHARCVVREYLRAHEHEPTLAEALEHSSDPVLTESLWPLPLDDKLLLELHYSHELTLGELSEVFERSREHLRERLDALQQELELELRRQEPGNPTSLGRRVRAVAESSRM